MSQWLSRVRTARRGTITIIAAGAALILIAVFCGLLDGDGAATVIAVASLLAALFAWDTTGRAADIAEQSHRTAELVAQIEHDRRHAELTPQLEVSLIEPWPAADRALLQIELVGPTSLHKLDEVTVEVRNGPGQPRVQTAGGPTADELPYQIWGPMCFDPNIRGVVEPGRKGPPFALVIGDSDSFWMSRTHHPHWIAAPMWDVMYRDMPVRLWVTCVKDGHMPWQLPFEVELTPQPPRSSP